MKFKVVTFPISGASTLKTSTSFDTEGLPIVGLTHYNSGFASVTPVNLKFQTLQVGQDVNNPSATWIDILEASPGINTDADDAGSLTLESVRPFLNLPSLQFVQGGDEFFLIPRPYVPLMKQVPTAETLGSPDIAASPAEGPVQQMANQIARLSNYGGLLNKIPNILRLAMVTDNATLDAVKTFIIALGDNAPTRIPAEYANTKRVTVTFANGDADSSYFELGPGERLAGIFLPAAFTTTNLTLQCIKPNVNGSGWGDFTSLTDANWLNVVQYVTDAPAFASALPTPIFKLINAAQGNYYSVPDMPYLEMPRYLRLHGSGNQGAARTVTLLIATNGF